MRLVTNDNADTMPEAAGEAAAGLERQVGEQIRELRVIKRLTLQQLAEMVGVSASSSLSIVMECRSASGLSRTLISPIISLKSTL